MNIYLVRHGEAAALWDQHNDPGLSEIGKQQAAAAAKKLHSSIHEPVQIISSPMLRTQQTAAPLTQLLQYPVSINNAFREVPNLSQLSERRIWLLQFMIQQWSGQPKIISQWRDALLRELEDLQVPTIIFTHFLVMNAIVGKLIESKDTGATNPTMRR